MNREQMWAALAQRPDVDLVVIGGGATGLGVALDARLRGHRVALFESNDFASGTSSRSTKLLHGGVRYLAQGHLPLVREALAERRTLLRLAPHLARPLAFVMPAYHWWQAPFYGAGLKLYDLLAATGANGSLGGTSFLGRASTLERLPGIQARGLLGGVQYWDAQFDDARYAVALARSAAQEGVQVFNHAPVTGLRRSGGGQVEGVEVFDEVRGRRLTVTARCVVNAAGVWVDELLNMAEPGAGGGADSRLQPLVSPSQGVHLVVDRALFPGDCAMLVPKTSDGRVLFAVPWYASVILGTTDTPREDCPREPRPLAGEVAFILDEAARYLGRPVKSADVKSAWVGLRPLVRPLHAQPGQTASVSREHTVIRSHGALVTVTGGKWTTYRAMAEDVVGRCEEWGLLSRPSGPCRSTADRVLEADTWGGCVTQLDDARVQYAVAEEMAVTVEDVLARRSRMLFTDARRAASFAPDVARALQACTGVDPKLADFLRLAERYASLE